MDEAALPPELWREIFSFLPVKDLLCSASLCSHQWLNLARSDWVWTPLIVKTFGSSESHGECKSSYELYKTLFSDSWADHHPEIQLSSNNQVATGTSYRKGVGTKGKTKGKHFWEVTVERDADGGPGNTAIGIGNEPYNTHASFTNTNKGIGCYFDGNTYCSAKDTVSSHKLPNLKKGDKVGLFMNLDDNQLTFYHNRIPQSPTIDIYRGSDEMMYLTAMMNAGDVLSIRYFGSCPPEITSTTTTS